MSMSERKFHGGHVAAKEDEGLAEAPDALAQRHYSLPIETKGLERPIAYLSKRMGADWIRREAVTNDLSQARFELSSGRFGAPRQA